MINIAELLKDAPKDMKLYSPLFGEVKFVGINKQSVYPIDVTDCKGNGKSFTEFGVYFADHPDAECLLFPSKDCRTWEGWKLPTKFKVGDWIVQNDNGTVSQITKVINDTDEYGEYRAYEHTNGYFAACFEKEYHLWTIKDAKDGDVLANDHNILILKELNYGWWTNGIPTSIFAYCGIKPNGNFELGKEHWCFCGTLHIHPATKEQHDLLFAKMKEAGYQWNVDKKELRKIQPHYDIKKFHAGMPVLVRADNVCRWDYSVFSRITGNEDWPFAVCNGVSFTQCIPFEGNEYLLGTTDMCPEEYINW